jgi:hypothetical protein
MTQGGRHYYMLEFRPMSDPLSIPDDKRAGTARRRRLSDARREQPWSFWIIVAVIVVLNGWFDYYHPRGILFDVIFLMIWAAKSN